MKRWVGKIAYALGLLGVALACVVGAPVIAKADTPDVMLGDLTHISTYNLKFTHGVEDNYGNTYSTAAYTNVAFNNEFEYLLDGKYSRFTATIFMEKGSSKKENSTVSIIADGKELSSTSLDRTSRPVTIDVDVKGCNDFKIIIYLAALGEGDIYLGNPGFYYANSTPTPTPTPTPDNPKPTPTPTPTPDNPNPDNPSGGGSSSGTVDVYRLYNPRTHEHHYTTDAHERDVLARGEWYYEDVCWKSPTQGNPVYRLYNTRTGEHHYTTDTNERNYLARGEWNDEGICWYSPTNTSGATPVYRLYNPSMNGAPGSHHYTTDANERNVLSRGAWTYEGVCWYGL